MDASYDGGDAAPSDSGPSDAAPSDSAMADGGPTPDAAPTDATPGDGGPAPDAGGDFLPDMMDMRFEGTTVGMTAWGARAGP